MKGHNFIPKLWNLPVFPLHFTVRAWTKPELLVLRRTARTWMFKCPGMGDKKNPFKKQTLDLAMVYFWSPEKNVLRFIFFTDLFRWSFFFFLRWSCCLLSAKEMQFLSLLHCFQRPFPEVLTPTREPLPKPGPDSG